MIVNDRVKGHKYLYILNPAHNCSNCAWGHKGKGGVPSVFFSPMTRSSRETAAENTVPCFLKHGVLSFHAFRTWKWDVPEVRSALGYINTFTRHPCFLNSRNALTRHPCFLDSRNAFIRHPVFSAPDSQGRCVPGVYRTETIWVPAPHFLCWGSSLI